MIDEGLLTSLTIIVSITAWLIARYAYNAQRQRMELSRERLQLDIQERLALIHLEETKAQAQVEIARCQSQMSPHIESHPAGQLN